MLLAAKVLVISRLLHTKLSQGPRPPPYLESLRNKLGSLRRKLLARIDRRFQSQEVARNALVESMCAFALATSSSSKDVLRHFHHVRQAAMNEKLGSDHSSSDEMLEALRLYVRTLSDTQAVVPKQLMHAMGDLKSTPLFRNLDVQSIDELSMDVHERWVADDIKSFVPYIRPDDLSKGEAERLSKQWAKEAFESFNQGLRRNLDSVEDSNTLIELRRQIIELWLLNHQHLVGIDVGDALDSLRDVFNDKITRMIKARASRLEAVGSVVSHTVYKSQPGVSDALPSLWESASISLDLSSGGKALRESLTNRSFGKTEPLNKFLHEYKSFLEGIKAIEGAIKKLKETKWDDVDDMNDDDDILDNKQVLLSEDDPRQLQSQLNDALSAAYHNLEVGLTKLHPSKDDENKWQNPCFLIRIWRELRQQLPYSHQTNSLGITSITSMQEAVSEQCLKLPVQRYSRRTRKAGYADTLIMRPLWEGDPALPVLPAQQTYRLLLDVTAFMTKCGSDIWSPSAMDILKRQLREKAAVNLLGPDDSVNGHVNGPDDSETADANAATTEQQTEPDQAQQQGNPETKHTNGALTNGLVAGPSPGSKTDSTRDLKVQKLLDISYLLNALTPAAKSTADINEENRLATLQDSLVEELALDAREVSRIKKNAEEYWKRTSLLFGLLA